ncbi:MAG: hypothetical protein NC311_02380 [Muribaculaceae bacterium]|nr:hypothetical protein [Muribaculaceae bacterium]
MLLFYNVLSYHPGRFASTPPWAGNFVVVGMTVCVKRGDIIQTFVTPSQDGAIVFLDYPCTRLSVIPVLDTGI